MEPRLAQIQSQRLILSPQMRQYLKLLQLPIHELQQAVEEELAINPLLEEKPLEKQEIGEDDNEASSPTLERSAEELHFDEGYEKLNKIEDYWEAQDTYNDASTRTNTDLQKTKDFQESLITKPEALWDFLEWQIGFLSLDPDEKIIATHIIGNIDEDGYLKSDAVEISQALKQPLERTEKVLEHIQSLDPPGIGAANLQEALLLQLERKKGSKARVAYAIIKKHFAFFKKRDWQSLAKIHHLDLGTIKEISEIITHLEPRPGANFLLR